MITWADIARENYTPHIQALSQYLNEQGLKNQVIPIEANEDNFVEVFSEARDKFDSIRIGSPFRSTIIKTFQRQTYMARMMNAVDCLVKENGQWLLRTAFHRGFQRVVSRVGGLDTESSVLVVGAGSLTRVTIAVLLKVGFKTFHITNRFNEEGLVLIEELRRSYLGVKFNFIPQDQLVLQPGINSVLVNTTPHIEGNDLLDELLYFNFLKPMSLVIDYNLTPTWPPLLEGAKNIEHRVVQGYEVIAEVDGAWVEWVFKKSINTLDYQKYLLSRLEESLEAG
jgi:shikimate 5-dehydrogenase